MMSAFSYPNAVKAEQASPWGPMYYGSQPASMPPVVQQQQQQQVLPMNRWSHGGPDTPQAGSMEPFAQLWQAAAYAEMARDSYDEPSASAEEEPAQKKRKGPKGKRTGLDKMAKQELRMMKNRESAARSRARRQQHTVQLEQENEDLRAQVQDLQTTAERLREQLESVKQQLDDAHWQLQLARVPQQRASDTVSHVQQPGGGAAALPQAPSISLSLPLGANSSLLMPGVTIDTVQEALDGVVPQDGFGMGFDSLAYMSRRGSSYA